MELNGEQIVTVISLICLTAYGIVNALLGRDKLLTVSVVAALAGLGGYKLKSWVASREG